jgi:phosphate starvation-inducible PhoH-like protein
LFGRLDENLRAIEEAFGVRLKARGTEISVAGDGPMVPVVQRMLSEFSELLQQGHALQKTDVQTAIAVLKEDPGASLVDFFGRTIRPTLRAVGRRATSSSDGISGSLGEGRVMFDDRLGRDRKTYLAVAMAAAALLAKDQAYRSLPAGRGSRRKVGFLPGDMVEKVNPYLRPLYDALYDILG